MSDERAETGGSGKPRLGAVRILVIIVMLIAGLAIAAAGAAVGGYAWVGWQFTRPGPVADDTTVLIPRGSGLGAIARQLEAEGLIRDERVFRLRIRLDDSAAPVRAGEYAVPAEASMAQIYDILRYGETIQHPVRVPEGLTTAMVVRILEAHPMLDGELTDIPGEGEILPETYLVDRGTSRQEVLDRLREGQRRLLARLWAERQEGLPYETLEEAIILASIVEKETGVGDERPLVASVFVNRLRQGMRLQSDPTIIYGVTGGEPLGRGIRRSELDDETNPYNTYFITGLTPGPIANPGRASIEAVLDPPETDYLYFVADGTGGHAFARTLAEHNRNVANWRRIERERAAAREEQN
jgi:UPF0755 protein